jgi:hypothetical protein
MIYLYGFTRTLIKLSMILKFLSMWGESTRPITELIATMSGRKDVVKVSGAHLFFNSKHRVIMNIPVAVFFEVRIFYLEIDKSRRHLRRKFRFLIATKLESIRRFALAPVLDIGGGVNPRTRVPGISSINLLFPSNKSEQLSIRKQEGAAELKTFQTNNFVVCPCLSVYRWRIAIQPTRVE